MCDCAAWRPSATVETAISRRSCWLSFACRAPLVLLVCLGDDGPKARLCLPVWSGVSKNFYLYIIFVLFQNPTLLVKQVEPSGTKKKTPSVSAAKREKAVSVPLPPPSEGKKKKKQLNSRYVHLLTVLGLYPSFTLFL